jgi:hypothetical protein
VPDVVVLQQAARLTTTGGAAGTSKGLHHTVNPSLLGGSPTSAGGMPRLATGFADPMTVRVATPAGRHRSAGSIHCIAKCVATTRRAAQTGSRRTAKNTTS